ncbi:MAG: hypothetical protein ACTS3F_10995 [Phycisphaerales bacterium]
MRALLSPYELDPWSPAAAAALSIFDDTTTIRPLPPPETRQREAPALAALLDRWHWTAPLWQHQLLTALDDHDQPTIAHAQRIARAFQDDPRMAPIQRLTARGWNRHADDETQACEALCRSLLALDADPAFELPIAAAVDALAIRSGAIICRARGGGMIDALERRAAPTQLARFAIPTLLGAEGQQILDARARLEPQRDQLARAINNLTSAGAPTPTAIARLHTAADRYTAAFDEAYHHIPAISSQHHTADQARRSFIVITIARTTPDPTLAAAARLASIVGGRSHDRRLATAATTPHADPEPSLNAIVATDTPDALHIATIKRVAWHPTPPSAPPDTP